MQMWKNSAGLKIISLWKSWTSSGNNTLSDEKIFPAARMWQHIEEFPHVIEFIIIFEECQ